MGSFDQNPCSLERNGIPFYQEGTVQSSATQTNQVPPRGVAGALWTSVSTARLNLRLLSISKINDALWITPATRTRGAFLFRDFFVM